MARAECPHCLNETKFWIMDHTRGICPCTARRSWSIKDLNLNKLTHHGRTLEAAQWVVEQFGDLKLYADNKTVQTWVNQSKGIVEEYGREKE